MSDVNKSSIEKEPVITNKVSCEPVILDENTCTLKSIPTCPSISNVPSSPVTEICAIAQNDTACMITAPQTSELEISLQGKEARLEEVAGVAKSTGPGGREESDEKVNARLSDAKQELDSKSESVQIEDDEGQLNVCESEINDGKCIDDAWKNEMLSGTELGKIYHRQKLKNSPRLNKMFEEFQLLKHVSHGIVLFTPLFLLIFLILLCCLFKKYPACPQFCCGFFDAIGKCLTGALDKCKGPAQARQNVTLPATCQPNLNLSLPANSQYMEQEISSPPKITESSSCFSYDTPIQRSGASSDDREAELDNIHNDQKISRDKHQLDKNMQKADRAFSRLGRKLKK